MKKVVQFCGLAVTFLLLGQLCSAQEIAWEGGVGFGDTKIRHGMATVPDGALKFERANQSLGIGNPSQDSAPVVRMLKLPDGRSIVYKLLVKRLENGARFDVSLQAHEPTAEQIEKWGIDPARVEKGFLSKYTQPILLNSSDIIAVDVLVDPRTQAKLIDFFQISTGPPITRRNPDKLKAEAQTLTLDALELNVMGYEVRRNGEALYRTGGGTSGRFIYFDIPNVGRVIFTLTNPPTDSGFERTAIVNEKQLLFSIGADQYEWLSKEHIVHADGSFYVWMRVDPTFSIPETKLPPEVQKRIGSGWGHYGAFDRWPKGKEEEQ